MENDNQRPQMRSCKLERQRSNSSHLQYSQGKSGQGEQELG